jgi:hypothetical protein
MGRRVAKKRKKDLSKLKMEFVGRDELTGAFEKSYSNFKDIMNNGEDNLRVISYWGAGGIGKSTLLEHIKKDFLDQHYNKNNTKENSCNKSSFFSDTINLLRNDNDEIPSNNLSVYYDFGYKSDSTERVTIIFTLKNEMIKECGFKFPRLDVLNRVFDYLRGEEVKLSDIKKLIDENASYFKPTVEALGELPVIGNLFKIIKTLDDISEIKVKKYKSIEAVNEFLKEKEMAPLDMETELQEVFTWELNDNLEDLKEPWVIMFDRFEKTMEKTDTPHNAKCKVKWIYCEGGLIDSVPKVLWVIAGRKRLTWLDDYGDSWEGLLEINEVDKLDDKVVVDILRKRDIPDDLLDELAKKTGGIPEYIRLCINHADLLKAQNKKLTIEDFCGNSNRDDRDLLVERFTDHLSEKEQTMLDYLSVFDGWTDEMIEKVIPRVWTSYEDYVYQRVKDLPFFEFKENGKCVMKEVVRDVILTKLKAENPDFVNKVFNQIIEYLKSDLHVNNCEG